MEATSPRGIRIVAIQGSVRPANFTSKALALVVDELGKHADVASDLIDPATLDLPMPGTDGRSAGPAALQRIVAAATGVILATPEYHGSYSSVIKLVIENLGFPSVLAAKPVALLGVAAGQIGAIKALEHLRGVCAHVGAIVLPGSVSVALVRDLFDDAGRCRDQATEARIRGLATSLLDYIHGALCPRITLEEMARRGSLEWTKVPPGKKE